MPFRVFRVVQFGTTLPVRPCVSYIQWSLMVALMAACSPETIGAPADSHSVAGGRSASQPIAARSDDQTSHMGVSTANGSTSGSDERGMLATSGGSGAAADEASRAGASAQTQGAAFGGRGSSKSAADPASTAVARGTAGAAASMAEDATDDANGSAADGGGAAPAAMRGAGGSDAAGAPDAGASGDVAGNGGAGGASGSGSADSGPDNIWEAITDAVLGPLITILSGPRTADAGTGDAGTAQSDAGP